MRVLVCCDAIGTLSSLQAGQTMAAAWGGAQTAVVPTGEAGGGFLTATADLLGVEPAVDVIVGRLVSRAETSDTAVVAVPGPGVGSGPIPYDATSRVLGVALAAVLHRHRSRVVLVDLVSDDVHDGGAGLLAALGATADVALDRGVTGLAELSALDLQPARQLLGGVDLVGVVPSPDRDQPLLGLRGITSVRGRAAAADPARLLAVDAALSRFAELCAVADQPGAGACGGTALAVLALGGRLSTGSALALGPVSAPVDLVVTGCSVFDFAARGGGVVAEAAAVAARLLCPCIVLAGEVLIGGREMRTLGIEAAYAVHDSTADAPTGTQVQTADLAALAARVARSWRW